MARYPTCPLCVQQCAASRPKVLCPTRGCLTHYARARSGRGELQTRPCKMRARGPRSQFQHGLGVIGHGRMMFVSIALLLNCSFVECTLKRKTLKSPISPAYEGRDETRPSPYPSFLSSLFPSSHCRVRKNVENSRFR